VGTLASSILQGYVVIDARAFAARFPSIAGNRVFLVDLPSAEYAAFDRRLKESALEDYGLTTVPASERLAAFEAVQNTYLSIFSVVGGLGLVVGLTLYFLVEFSVHQACVRMCNRWRSRHLRRPLPYIDLFNLNNKVPR
jgi:hypothetical protein